MLVSNANKADSKDKKGEKYIGLAITSKVSTTQIFFKGKILKLTFKDKKSQINPTFTLTFKLNNFLFRSFPKLLLLIIIFSLNRWVEINY